MRTHHGSNKRIFTYCFQKKVNTLLPYLHDIRFVIYNLYVLFVTSGSEIWQTPFTPGIFQNWIIWKRVEQGNTFFIAQLQMYIVLILERWSAKSCLIFVPSLHLFLNSPFLSKCSFFKHFLPPFKTDLELQLKVTIECLAVLRPIS